MPLPERPTIKQAADYLNVHPRTVRRYIAEGRLTATRIGPRMIRLDKDSLLKLAYPIGGKSW